MGNQLPLSGQKIDPQQVLDRSDLADLPESVRSLTHDLRTPLTALQSCLQLLLRGDAGPLTADQKRFLNLADRNIDRLDRMVIGMLEDPRDTSPGITPGRPEVDLGSLLADAVGLHRMTATERGLELDGSGIPASFPAEVDPDLVTRILDNVLGNSLKFTPAGGLVRVWLEAGAGTPRSLAARIASHFSLPLATFNLIVEDSGPGLSPAVQSRIFEPFNPGTGIPGPRGPGSGLGLSITRQLAESHGGQVRLASLPGRGTTVWLKLPRDPRSENLQNAVDQLQETLYEGPISGIRPLVGVIDLRGIAGGPDKTDTSMDEFWETSTKAGLRGWKLVPGLWAAAVRDPVNLNRRWALHAAQHGGGLESTRWEFLALTEGKPLAVGGTHKESPETIVNPVPSVPIIF